MASAGNGVGTVSNNERTEHVRNKAEICDNILSMHRSMPDKTVSFTTNRPISKPYWLKGRVVYCRSDGSGPMAAYRAPSRRH